MSEFRTPLPDPNRGQNRVPSQMELATLRNIRSDKRQMVDSARRQLDTAKENHRRIQIRYENLVREVEGALSELNISHDHLAVLEKQLQVLQTEDDRLVGLLHPIRRCPEDILRLIFESAISIEPDNRFRTATTLSHVCKAWRATALSSRSLWNHIDVSMEEDMEKLESFMSRTRDRSRGGSVTLKLRGIPTTMDATEKVLNSIQLGRFEAILGIHYVVNSASDVMCLLEAPLLSLPPPTESLTIQAIRKPDDSPSFNFSEHLRRSSTLRSVTLLQLDLVILDGNDSFPSIQHLRLENVSMPTFALNLDRFLGLETLSIEFGNFEMLSPVQDVVLPNLWDMKIEDVSGFPWDKLSAPRLVKVRTDDMGEAAVAFICRHPLLQHLHPTVWYKGSLYQTLDKKLPNLGYLATGESIEELYKPVNLEAAHPLFPRLQSIEIDETQNRLLSINDFEGLLRSRCLHHNLEGEKDYITKISVIRIFTHLEDLEQRPWFKSTLLDHFEKKVEPQRDEEFCYVILKLIK